MKDNELTTKEEEELLAEISDQERLFSIYYVERFNATQAAKRAGYSEVSAPVLGHRLLRKVNVKAYIDYLASRLVSDAEIGVERILRELAKRAFVSVKDLYDEDGQLLHPSDLPDDVAAAISGLDVDVVGKFGKKDEEGGEQQQVIAVKYKLACSDKALEQLGRYHKMFTDNLNHSGKITLEDLVAGSGDDE